MSAQRPLGRIQADPGESPWTARILLVAGLAVKVTRASPELPLVGVPLDRYGGRYAAVPRHAVPPIRGWLPVARLPPRLSGSELRYRRAHGVFMSQQGLRSPKYIGVAAITEPAPTGRSAASPAAAARQIGAGQARQPGNRPAAPGRAHHGHMTAGLRRDGRTAPLPGHPGHQPRRRPAAGLR